MGNSRVKTEFSQDTVRLEQKICQDTGQNCVGIVSIGHCQDLVQILTACRQVQTQFCGATVRLDKRFTGSS